MTLKMPFFEYSSNNKDIDGGILLGTILFIAFALIKVFMVITKSFKKILFFDYHH